MDLLLIAIIVGSSGLLARLIWQGCRCAVGWHPHEGRQMRPGQRERGHSRTQWTCGRCQRTIATERYRIDPRLLRTLRSQVGASRARSKVIEWHVVKKAVNDDRDSAV